MGKYNEGYTTEYFAGSIRLIGATVTQTVPSDYPIFTVSLTGTELLPTETSTVPGISLDSCKVYGYTDGATLHNMETVNALITYSNCVIKGDVLSVGTDSTDTGLGKVIIGEGTAFTAADPESVKPYDSSAITTYDGSSSGVYLAENTALEPTESGYKVTKK